MSNRRFAVITTPHATRGDVLRILGDLDYLRLIDILRLRPTVHHIEQASSWLADNRDVFGRDRPPHAVTAGIVEIIIDRKVGALQMR